MFYDTEKNDHGLPFNPFKSCVIPRPVGWVSTLSHDGIVNTIYLQGEAVEEDVKYR